MYRVFKPSGLPNYICKILRRYHITEYNSKEIWKSKKHCYVRCVWFWIRYTRRIIFHTLQNRHSLRKIQFFNWMEVCWVRWNVKFVINFLWSRYAWKNYSTIFYLEKCYIFYAFLIKVHMVQVKQLHATTKDFLC